MAFHNVIEKIATVDLFEYDPTTKEYKSGIFIGRPFSLDYEYARILVADAWKQRARGIPQGTFLLAYYENEDHAMFDLKRETSYTGKWIGRTLTPWHTP